MDGEKLDRVLRTVDPAKRGALKKMVISAAFAVPIIASYSVKDLAYASVGSCPVTITSTSEFFLTTFTTTTTTSVVTITATIG